MENEIVPMPRQPPVHRSAGVGNRQRPHSRSPEAQQCRRLYRDLR
jgi:hypothetical protein